MIAEIKHRSRSVESKDAVSESLGAVDVKTKGFKRLAHWDRRWFVWTKRDCWLDARTHGGTCDRQTWLHQYTYRCCKRDLDLCWRMSVGLGMWALHCTRMWNKFDEFIAMWQADNVGLTKCEWKVWKRRHKAQFRSSAILLMKRGDRNGISHESRRSTLLHLSEMLIILKVTTDACTAHVPQLNDPNLDAMRCGQVVQGLCWRLGFDMKVEGIVVNVTWCHYQCRTARIQVIGWLRNDNWYGAGLRGHVKKFSSCVYSEFRSEKVDMGFSS